MKITKHNIKNSIASLLRSTGVLMIAVGMLTIATGTLTSCSESELAAAPGNEAWQNDPTAMKVNATVGSGIFSRSNPLGADEATQKAFNNGDQISIAAGTQGAVTYTLNNGTWTPETGKYLKWETNSDPMEITAYYPVAEGASAQAFTLPADQEDDTKIVAADYMTYGGNQSKPTTGGELTMEMERKMARVIVKIAGFNDQYDGTVPTVNNVRIKSGAASYAAGAAEGDATEVTPFVQNLNAEAAQVGTTYTALVIPTDKKADEQFITMTVAGTPLTVKDIPAMEAGKSYTYNLTIGKDALTVGEVTVTNWITETIEGGEAKQVCISYNSTSKVLEIATASGLNLFRCMMSYTPTEAELSAANLTKAQYDAMKTSAAASNYNAVLTSDIDLSEYDSWKSINPGSYAPYKGVFDGQGHSISGFKSDYNTDTSKSYIGLFGYADAATFRNLTIVAPTMVTFERGGALVGTAKACTISNCTATDVNITGSQNTGSLIGVMEGNGLVENCYSSGKITGVAQQSAVLGGLIGTATGIVQRCGSTVEISAPEMQQIGGLAGQAYACKLVACYAKGNVEGKMMVGGLVGSMSDAVNITGCYVTGNIKGNSYIGALTGSYYGSTANVTGFYYGGASDAIDLVGRVYSSGSVMKIKYCASKSRGGLFGSNPNIVDEKDVSLFIGNQFKTTLTFAEIRAVVASAEAQSVWGGVEPDAAYVDVSNVHYNLSGNDSNDSFWLEGTDDSLKFRWE
ncbi:fimbrillin family protein [Bacteroides helcogenes]|uniref:GLUG domain-containing protein n=1 Tax=Bacteroides helcogenes (strain ATCC 35417 / DSM 20613 / JCM 6297 / CCUG 15421 / P 36-108) TaxID=693979 RepID=E6SNB4_BACT6|nr:fimbrillin family protein [Bacteroides helcogenes]ADV42707.1 hypothetical protein Bache_0684 [Bacteroides helcogenes P 36-108]MDY5239538.1 fimbrillin family protein [Bacteroides helcogenes]